jgi:hypothetical protein
MPALVAPGATRTTVAAARVPASCHHWVRYPDVPQPDWNSTRYLPGTRPVSRYPLAWLTATTGRAPDSGLAATQMPGSEVSAGAGPVTMPEIMPSLRSVAPIPFVACPGRTTTTVAAALVVLAVIPLRREPTGRVQAGRITEKHLVPTRGQVRHDVAAAPSGDSPVDERSAVRRQHIDADPSLRFGRPPA